MSRERTYPSSLVEEYSPSLPKDFPQELVPKNLCEMELIKYVRCERIFKTNSQCIEDHQAFLNCKKERDLELFKIIKEWEIKHFGSFKESQRALYYRGLTFKKDRLKDEVQRIPSSFSYQNRLWRFNADIEQLEWRLNYLKPFVQSSKQA